MGRRCSPTARASRGNASPPSARSCWPRARAGWLPPPTASASPPGMRSRSPAWRARGACSATTPCSRDALAAAEFVRDRMRDGSGRLARIWNEGRASVPAFLDDFASWIEATLDLYRAGAGDGWLGAALAACEDVAARFFDPAEGDLFLTPADGEPLVHRPRSDHDGATPHSTGLAVLGLLRAAELAGRADLRRIAERVIEKHAAPAGARAARLSDARTGGARRGARLLGRRDRGRGQRSRDARARRAGAARARPRRRRRRRRARQRPAARSGARAGSPDAIRRAGAPPPGSAAASAARSRSSSPTRWIPLRQLPRCASVRHPPSGRSEMARDETRYGKGHDDGLTALTALDPAATQTIDQLVRAMSHTAFGGRRLGEAADVLEAMVRDPDCYRVLTISGAMTIAKQGLLVCEMIDRGWVQAVVTTGALMTHGLSEGVGMLHFKHRPSMPDTELYEKGYNRVYDTIELEQNLDDIERILEPALDALADGTVLSSRLITRMPGALPGTPRAGARDPEERVPEGRAGLRAGLHGLRARARRRDLQRQASRQEGLRPALQPLRRSRGLHRADPPARDARHLHDRRRRSAQLGAAGGPVSRHPAQAPARSTSRCAATSTRCGSAPSPTTGAGSRAAATAKACRGASSCPRARAAASPRSSPTPPSPGRWWCAR